MDKNKLEKINLIGQTIASFVTVIGLSVIVWQAFVAAEALKVQAKAVEVQAWGGINQQMAEINKAVMEHPELYPYFNEGKKCRRSDKIYPKVASMADMYLDFIDQFDDDYVRGLAGMKDGGKYWLAWEKYFQDQFKLAPALCTRYEEVRSWYVEKGLVDTLAKQCNQVDQKK